MREFTLAVNQLPQYHTRLLQDHLSRRVNVAPEQPDGLIDPPLEWICQCDWQCDLAPTVGQDHHKETSRLLSFDSFSLKHRVSSRMK